MPDVEEDKNKGEKEEADGRKGKKQNQERRKRKNKNRERKKKKSSSAERCCCALTDAGISVRDVAWESAKFKLFSCRVLPNCISIAIFI